MHSELFSLFGFHFQMYGLMLALGFMACYIAARKLASLSGRNPGEVDTLILLAALCGIIGARAVYVFQNWQTEFADNPGAIFAVWRGGLVFYGGPLLAAVGLAIYAKVKREGIANLLGFCAVFIPLGHAFGRIGCFFHGCCFGGLCENALGVRFPQGSPAWLHQVGTHLISARTVKSLPVYPTQLIEAAGCLVLFIALWMCYRKASERVRSWLCLGVYMVCYAILRFGIELLRDDPRGAFVLGLSFSQWISIGLFIAGGLCLAVSIWERRHGTSEG